MAPQAAHLEDIPREILEGVPRVWNSQEDLLLPGRVKERERERERDLRSEEHTSELQTPNCI